MSWKISINTEHFHDVYNSISVKDKYHEFVVYLAKEEDSIGDVVTPDSGELFIPEQGREYINSSIEFNCFLAGDELFKDSESDKSSKHEFIPCPHCGVVPPKEFMKFVKNPLLLKMGNKL